MLILKASGSFIPLHREFPDPLTSLPEGLAMDLIPAATPAAVSNDFSMKLLLEVFIIITLNVFQFRYVNPAPFCPALKSLLCQLNPFGTFKQIPWKWLIFYNMPKK